MAFDQPDNAARLRDLGVAQMLSPSRFRTAAVARTLDALLRSPDVANQCQLLATRLRETGSGLESACDAIEQQVADIRWTLPKYSEMLFHN